DIIGFEATRFTPFESTFDFKFLLIQNKLEWQGTLADRLFVSVIAGKTGSESSYLSHSTDPITYDLRTQWVTGETFSTYHRNFTVEKRDQVNGSMSYFPEHFLGGSHEFKLGGNWWTAGWPR